MKYQEFTISEYHDFKELLVTTEGVSNRSADECEGIRKYLERNPGHSFAAYENEIMVGCALCGHDGRRGYLQHVMVRPEYRKKGIARALVEMCLDALAEVDIKKTHIDVFKTNDLANKYWEKNGWHLREDINRYSLNRSADENI
ncbi:MAG: GNAT family N-acetyltransferase [Verrucomicrobiota bacterium]